jgi:hypothetical protein
MDQTDGHTDGRKGDAFLFPLFFFEKAGDNKIYSYKACARLNLLNFPSFKFYYNFLTIYLHSNVRGQGNILISGNNSI